MTEYYPKGFGLKAEVKDKLAQDFHNNSIVEQIKQNGYTLQRGSVTLHLAKEFGFCYGVERTVQYAYETLERFPDRDIYVHDEIIHNPFVNERLIELGMKFLHGRYACGTKVDQLKPQDVVLITAFGATVQDLEKLRAQGCVLVDTTCGSVLNVWKNVERYAREGVTAVIHGKYWHEETRATASQVSKYPGGKYLVVKDLAETAIVCNYVKAGGSKQDFLEQFEQAASPGFDPDRDLRRVGLANQTTMLCSESLRVEKMLREAMIARYGEAELAKHFVAFDTICTATQDRQDAITPLLQRKLDLALVVGGFNSSNTAALARMAAEKTRAYHIQDETCMISATQIRHRDPKSGQIVESTTWLPVGTVDVGITSGASTPNSILGRVITRLLELKG